MEEPLPPKSSGGIQTGAAKSAKYTCPMHPQIVQLGPGSCPICGMALEPLEVLAVAEVDPEYASMLRRFWVSAALIRSAAGDRHGRPLAAHPLARRNAKLD